MQTRRIWNKHVHENNIKRFDVHLTTSAIQPPQVRYGMNGLGRLL